MTITKDQRAETRTEGPLFLSPETLVALGAALRLLPPNRHGPSELWQTLRYGADSRTAAMDAPGFGLLVAVGKLAEQDVNWQGDKTRLQVSICEDGETEGCTIDFPSGLVGQVPETMPDDPATFALGALHTYAMWEWSHVEPASVAAGQA